jgi:hypothetical protein
MVVVVAAWRSAMGNAEPAAAAGAAAAAGGREVKEGAQ